MASTKSRDELLLKKAKQVLKGNLLNGVIIPAQGLYPHQVLWDSCFIAIGLSHYDIRQAQKQVIKFFDAQWLNGMVPHIIFNPLPHYWYDRRIWRSWISPLSNKSIATSGLTQPPMLAEAIVSIGTKLNKTDRLEWYNSVFDQLIAYHSWLYKERDPKGKGLIVLVHPWETGLDNTPPWLESLRHRHAPWWINLMVWLKIDKVADRIRFDGKYVDYSQRSSSVEALRLYDALRHIRSKKYDTSLILQKPPFAIEDLTFNCLFIRANQHLLNIAKEIERPLPSFLLSNIRKSQEALEQLWDEDEGMYFSRNIVTGNFLKEISISSLLPIYSGVISDDRADKIVSHIKDFDVPYPIPSVPPSSSWFNPMRYWQGPSWVNINWLMIDGLNRYGYKDLAEDIINKTLQMVDNSGFYEYYNPLTGEPAGVYNFSWTAALVIDMLMNRI